MHRDKNDTRLDHAECACRAQRHVDDASFDEGTTIIDAAANRPVAILDDYHAAERTRPVRASHFAGTTNAGIVGSQAALRSRVGDNTCDKQRRSQASKSGPKQLTPSVPYTAAISPRNNLSSRTIFR